MVHQVKKTWWCWYRPDSGEKASEWEKPQLYPTLKKKTLIRLCFIIPSINHLRLCLHYFALNRRYLLILKRTGCSCRQTERGRHEIMPFLASSDATASRKTLIFQTNRTGKKVIIKLVSKSSSCNWSYENTGSVTHRKCTTWDSLFIKRTKYD